MNDIKSHYQELFRQHGASPMAVQYSDTKSQWARFKILTDIDPNIKSVLDVGCGLCHLWDYLRSTGNACNYLGVDNVPEFVDYSNNKMSDNSKSLLLDDLTKLPSGYDYVLVSGMFNNKMDDNWSFMKDTLQSMYRAANKGIAFNAMSTYVDYQDAGLFYVDPILVWRFCKTELKGNPVLRHDYSLSEGGFPFEFACYVYKEPASVISSNRA
ncbi:class I SAM-dependent methyltransferase [Paracoccaceae bacterium]|nr:class I SAM-dependent methyltransferase [Paracoccaceae bacterium]